MNVVFKMMNFVLKMMDFVDNFHANDYDQGRRIYLGPYDGRDAAILSEPCFAGILSNPNVQYECNFVPLATLCKFVSDPVGYEPTAAATAAVGSWAKRFGEPITVADVQLLVDLCYLPYSNGPRAEALLVQLDALHAEAEAVASGAVGGAAKLVQMAHMFYSDAEEVADLFERLTEIKQRENLPPPQQVSERGRGAISEMLPVGCRGAVLLDLPVYVGPEGGAGRALPLCELAATRRPGDRSLRRR